MFLPYPPPTRPPSTHPVVLEVDLHHPHVTDDVPPLHPPPMNPLSLPSSTHPVILKVDFHDPDVADDTVDDTDDRLCDVRDVQDPTVLQAMRDISQYRPELKQVWHII